MKVVFLVMIWCGTSALAEVALQPATRPYPAPPAPPPAVIRELAAAPGDNVVTLASQIRYWIGEPTDEEQLYLEYINRSRADPQAEAQRLKNTADPDVLGAYDSYGVDLDLMVSQFDSIAAAPPLSMNSNLTHAARLHSGDMLTNQFQGHTGTDGSTLSQRVTSAGYATWTALAENVFSDADSVFHGHAGFNVDWGSGPGGMQTPPGHRISIHSPNYREIGIGVVLGSSGLVGPQLVTQDFGSRSGLTPFVTGVVYYDLNGNGFYDLGEGLGGVTVNVSDSAYYAVTADSGGYSVPVPGNGSYTVTFSAPNIETSETTAVVSGGQNVKADHLPPYLPSVISGPDPASVNQLNAYTFTPVGAATAYRWRQAQPVPFVDIEGAESGEADITSSISPGYTLIVSDAKASGSFSFRMAHPEAVLQWFQWNRSIRPSATSELQFASRLGWATSAQVARAQISTDDGASWETVWSQAGTGEAGETSFSSRAVSLAAFAGREIGVRFAYAHTGGFRFAQTSAGVGFYVDDISVTDAEELLNPIETEVVTTTFNFVPATAGDYLLQVAAKAGDRTFPYGPALPVSAVEGLPQVVISGIAQPGAGQIQIDFTVSGGTPAGFELQTATDPAGTWSGDTGASIQAIVAGSQYRAATTTGGAALRFYRIRILP